MTDHVPNGLTCEAADDLAPGFVLGALEAAEMDAVRQHLATCENPHAEFAELGSVVPALFETVELVEPPAELGDRIMRAAQADAARSAFTAPVARPAPAADAVTRAPVRGRPYAWIALAAAAAVVAAALGIWNFQLRGQVDELAAYREAVLAAVERASEAGGQFALLSAPEGASGAAGLAGVGADGTVAVAMRDLAPTSGTEVYEVWAIAGSGAPVPIGSFTVGGNGTGGVVTSAGSNAAGVTIALTREPRPGMTAPTMPIIAVGVAAPPPG